MSYVDFESDGVDYRLILSRHDSKREEPIDGLDALVLETGGNDPASYAPHITKRVEILNYIDEIKENDIPVYSVDNKGKDYLLSMITFGGHVQVIPIMVYGISKLAGADDYIAFNIAIGTILGELAIMSIPSFLGNDISSFFAKINSALSMIRQAPVEELRNALTAKKIKNGVVPHLLEQYPERFHERNPKIGILYGAGHSGIKECLESDLRTNFTLGLHKHYGLRLVLDRNTLRDFYEYRLNADGKVNYKKLQVDSI